MMTKGKSLRSICLLICLSIAVLGISGCSSSNGTETKSSTGTVTSATQAVPDGRSANSDIIAATDQDLITLDPHDATKTMDGAVQRMIMDGFFGFDSEMNVVNMLATGYEANEDATEFIIPLRKGVSFTDGTAWNAEAAKTNLDRMADQSLGLKRNGLFTMIDTTEILDEYTIKITLKYSFGAFVNTLAHPAGAMISPVQIKAGKEACASNPVGTGQYKFVEWRPGESWKLELNEEWWGYSAELNGGTPLVDPKAGFSSITFKPVTESATRVAMIQSGDVDYIFPVPAESYQVLEADSNVNVYGDESITMYYVYMNTQKAALSDLRVRQALNYAINKEAYVAVVYNGLASPAASYMSPAVQFYAEQPAYEYDVEKAKKLLAEAGYGDGLTLKGLTTNTSTSIKYAEFVQQQLAMVGITVTIEPLETGTFSEQVNNHTGGGSSAPYDIVFYGWSPSTGDADWVLRAIFSSTLAPPNGSAYSYFENEEFEQAIQDGLNSANLEVRANAYARAQQILWEQCPAVPMGSVYNTYATSSRISNVGRLKDGGIYFREGYFLE